MEVPVLKTGKPRAELMLVRGGITNIVLEKDYIPISPYRYGTGDIIFLMDEEKKEEVVEKAVWEEEEEVRLKR